MSVPFWWSFSEDENWNRPRKPAQTSASSLRVPVSRDFICLQCRQNFKSNNKLHEHVRNDCWATKNEHKYPDQWTPALKDYVRRAFDPANSEPGWPNAKIQRELEAMIETNFILDPRIGARWRTMEVPQRIDPKDLPYVRPEDETKNQSIKPHLAISKTYPEQFYAPWSTPQSMFAHKDGSLFVAHRDSRELLVYTDGACANNGQAGSQGGCAFVTHYSDKIPEPCYPPPGAYHMYGMFFFRLEDVGPTGLREQQTSNRAELRAVLAALSWFRQEHADLNSWKPKELAKLVIATDSTYVLDGATKWAKKWESNGWKLNTGERVKNRDLWEELLKRVRALQADRCEKISIWHIPREQNRTADRGAKFASKLKARPEFGVPAPGSHTVLVDASQLD
jgi:ribonuclease HI